MGVLNFIQGYFTGKVFEANQFKIYALQRSELLDDKICNYCVSMDGRTVEPGDPITKHSQFHSRCRGIWVEIGIEETGKPIITGIPKYLRDKIGSSNDSIQIPKAMPLSGSLAEEFVNKKKILWH